MRDNKTSVDGFIPRRPGSQIGDLHNVKHPERMTKVVDRTLHTSSAPEVELGKPRANHSLGRQDFDASLNEAAKLKKLTRKQKKDLKLEQKALRRRKTKRIAIWTVVILGVIILAVGGFFAWKVLGATSKVFQGNLLDIVKDEPLKQDKNGFSNFLIMGTSEDDPNHPGGNLTDSIMIVSVNQTTKQSFMFSVPRDLYVDYGMACVSGYSGKINVYFSCADKGTDDQAEQNRLNKTAKFIGNIFGLDIQYAVHVNNTVIKDAVDAVGGVDVDIEGDGADGILDRNFDWRCQYKCYYVKYDNGVHHLDGIHALFLAMARGDTAPTYGLANSNFDREQNQQKILLAIKQKATKTGTLANLSAVTKLIDAFGNNFHSNIPSSQIKTLMDLAQKVQSSDIHQIELNGTDAVVTTGTISGESVVVPTDGQGDYSGIRAYLKQQMSSDPVVREAANIAVLNGSGISGKAQTTADQLTDAGLNVNDIATAPTGNYGSGIAIYQLNSKDTGTAAKLKSLLHANIISGASPATAPTGTDFIVIIGKSAETSSSN